MVKLTRDPVDAYVGGRVKLRRGLIGMSQTQLADNLGITFQQVQKYEKGANRIGASRLFQISRHLGVPVQYFFEGAESVMNGGENASENSVGDSFDQFLKSSTGIELCRSFSAIDDPAIQKKLLALVKSLTP